MTERCLDAGQGLTVEDRPEEVVETELLGLQVGGGRGIELLTAGSSSCCPTVPTAP